MAESQLVFLSYVMPDGTTGEVALDASVSEQHGARAQVTEHQVESGPNITDYIRPMPRVLSIEGVVTNTPIATPQSQSRGVVGQPNSAQSLNGRTWKALQFSGQFDRVRDVYGILVDAALNGAIFDIATTLATYVNFAITDFGVPRNAGQANALHFSISFQQIRIVTTQVVAPLPAKKVHKGAKAPQQIPDTDQKATDARSKSALFSAAHGG